MFELWPKHKANEHDCQAHKHRNIRKWEQWATQPTSPPCYSI